MPITSRLILHRLISGYLFYEYNIYIDNQSKRKELYQVNHRFIQKQYC